MSKLDLLKFILFLIPLMIISACYTFQDASTEGISTVNVEFFPNQAEIINPQLSQAFTDKLKNKIISESTLKLRENNSDVIFKGAIIQYNIQPVAASNTNSTALSRLTIAVTVEYVNTLEEKKSWTATFSRFEDFDSNVNFNAVENQLVAQINDKIVDDIFRRAFVNW